MNLAFNKRGFIFPLIYLKGDNLTQEGLKITDSKGFHMTFENGVTISVQFGYSNYREGRSFSKEFGCEKDEHILFSSNAEVALWDKDDNWCTRQACKEALNEDIGDDVNGWTSVKNITKLIVWAESRPLESTFLTGEHNG